MVVRASTPLHRRPSGEAPSVTFDPRGETNWGETFGAFEVVDHQDEWIKIRNLASDTGEQHCIRGWQALVDFELDFWVRKADLQVVTRRPVMAKFGNGTSAMVAAGTPLMYASGRGDSRQFTALGPGASAELVVDENGVGAFYRPSSLYKPGDAVGTLPRETGLVLDERPIRNAALRGTGSAIDLFAKERRDDGTLVTVGTRCAELKVLARGRAPEPEGDQDARIAELTAELHGLERSPADRGYKFEAGAEVFWFDGEKAGRLAAPHVFDDPPKRNSDKRCFEQADLTLCLRADDMTAPERKKRGLDLIRKLRGRPSP